MSASWHTQNVSDRSGMPKCRMSEIRHTDKYVPHTLSGGVHKRGVECGSRCNRRTCRAKTLGSDGEIEQLFIIHALTIVPPAL